MTPILTITGLKCGYKAGIPVLDIPELKLPQGSLIFVVGASGGGKSTLLEALGLMNNTILDVSSLLFQEIDGNNIPLNKLWGAAENEIDSFRKKHFSFIFQKTNLMPNFTCGENMVLPALFKGQNYDTVREKVLNYMNKLGLDAAIYDKKISNISGGQRQRLAFIRAMVADFTILFGDEPTGNLDPSTARTVMNVLKSHLKTHGKTGIVVSHDIGLAVDFADMVIPITMHGNGENRMGFVNKVNLLYNRSEDSWMDERTHYDKSGLEEHLKKLIA